MQHLFPLAAAQVKIAFLLPLYPRRKLAHPIAQRVEYIAGQEGLELTTGGAELISRLADGAMRD